MYWDSFSDFLKMGGYGLYVWASFGLTALCMVLEPLWVSYRKRQTLKRLARQIEARAEAATPTVGEGENT